MRRRLCFVTLVCVLFTGRAEALLGVHPGIEGGFALTNFRYDEDFPPWDPGWDDGFSVGAFVDLDVAGAFSVVPAVRFVRYQNQIDVDTGPGSLIHTTGTLAFQQDYVSIPVIVKWAVVPLPVVDFFLAGGLDLGFLTAAKSKHDFVTQPGNDVDTGETDIKDRLEGTNLSLLIGAGADIRVIGHTAVVQLRYSHGITGVAKEDEFFSDWKTQAVEFIAGVAW